MKMENIMFLLYNTSDSSDGNSSLLREFPYWQPTLAVALFFNTTTLSGMILILYLPLLIVLLGIMKKEQLKALNLLHVSLLIASILDDILRICLNSIYYPSAFRYCVCSDLVVAVFIAEYVFFFVYWAFAFACLSVLQFLLVIGKRKIVNLKLACGMVALSIGTSFVCIASVVRQLYSVDDRSICEASFCPNNLPVTGLDNHEVVSLLFFLVVLLPSIAVVVVTSTWSCAVFKRYYTGGDDQLNRRMLSLPFIMPLVIIASSVLEALLSLLVTRVISMLSLGDLLPYWIIVADSMLLIGLHFFIRLVYPLVLLYTHTHLQQAALILLNRFKRHNRVSPGTSHASISS